MKEALHVLIAEDSEDDFELLVRELGRGDYEVHAQRIETAKAMIAALDGEAWDLIFSDWSMPSFDAPAVLRLLKDKEVDTPVIIVSGTVGEDVAVEALRSGAHDFLLKGSLTRLLPAVARELREARMRAEANRMREQLLVSDRMASVGLLAAGLAHEINNPLASVIAHLDLATRDFEHLATGDRGAQLSEELREARESAERIRRIVYDLKVFSRANDDAVGAVDVVKVIESSLRIAGNEIRHRANVVKALQPVPLVEANESRLGQVFLNLIVNAVQAVPEGRAEVNQIKVATGLDQGSIFVDISDTGSGMSPEVQKRLFTPFFTTKPIGVGTGLGLSICHRIVSSLGGSITVDSELGRGTRFRVTLPVAKNQVVAPAAPAPVVTKASRRGRVLVIDDEPMLLGAVRRTLAQDHDVDALTRASDALDKLRGGASYDVILCDLMMPDMTGIDLYNELEKTMPEQSAKIVFLTGGAFTPNARAFFESNKNLRIEKPFDTKALRATVNQRIR